jgi:hypothetical protein
MLWELGIARSFPIQAGAPSLSAIAACGHRPSLSMMTRT